jgi:hypothetical protein
MQKKFTKNLQIKKIWGLLLLPILFSCSTPCPSLTDIEPYNCDQCKPEFSACIKKNFPVGSSYVDLNIYLTKIGFERTQDSDDIKNNRFYFGWWVNDDPNLKFIISGRYNKKRSGGYDKIIELDVES